MALTQKERQQIWNKSKGHCWYCGCHLPQKGWHADHMNPVYRLGEFVDVPGHPYRTEYKQNGKMLRKHFDNIENIVPSCAVCNRFKGVFTVEQFRIELTRQIERARKTSVNFRMAEKYGLLSIIEKPIVFWFEAMGL